MREAVYQCAPFIGFPKTLNAIAAMNETFEKSGISLPLEDAATVTEDDRYEKGLAVQAPLYGTEIADRYTWLPARSPRRCRIPDGVRLRRFRDEKGTERKDRELLTVVMLAALGGARSTRCARTSKARLKRATPRKKSSARSCTPCRIWACPACSTRSNCSKELLS